MTQEAPAVPLKGGGRTTVLRRGGLVIRDAGPWTASVHAVLRHLQDAGFDGAPRVVGEGFDEQGREVLTYVEGEVVHPAPWSDNAIHSWGGLMRRLHDATARFRPPEKAQWRPWFGRSVGEPDIIGHCDGTPWNVIWRYGKPDALIDWEAAGPVDRLTELALAAWSAAQLYDDDVAAMNGLPDAGHRLKQVRIFADAYGLPARQRRGLAERIIEFAAQSAANEVVEQQITPETDRVPRLWGIAWQTRSVAWLMRHRHSLEAVLV